MFIKKNIATTETLNTVYKTISEISSKQAIIEALGLNYPDTEKL